MGVEKANPNQKGTGVVSKRKRGKDAFAVRRAERITWIKIQIEKDPLLQPLDLFPRYTKRFELSKTTFKKDCQDASRLIQEDLEVIQQAISQQKVTNALYAVEKGGRTKEDRIKQLNDLIDQTEADLRLGTHKQERIVNNKAISYDRALTPMEKIRYRDAIKGYISEICRINGEYAPKHITFDSDMFDGMTRNEITDAIEIFTPYVELAPIEE